MKFLFILDPIDKLKPASDTSFAFIQESLKRKHSCFYTTQEKLSYFKDEIKITANSISSFNKEKTPQLEAEKLFSAKYFNTVFIRRDPPFDSNYIKLCWFLSLTPKSVYLFNHPTVLLRYHEKLGALEAYHQGFLKKTDFAPTYIGREGRNSFIEDNGATKFISKPFLGFGGNEIDLFDKDKLLNRPIESDKVIQPFLPEISKGDFRVFFLGGKIIGYFVRLPKEGHHVSNLAQGGRPALEKLTAAQNAVLKRLSPFLKKSKIDFAGVDLIGSKISEINITSPTGIRAYEKLTGKNLSEPIIRYVESKSL